MSVVSYKRPYSYASSAMSLIGDMIPYYRTAKRGYDLITQYGPKILNAYKKYKNKNKNNQIVPRNIGQDFSSNISSVTNSSYKPSAMSMSSLMTSIIPNQDKNQNYKIGRNVKRKKVSAKMPMRVFDIIAPPLVMTAEYKPDCYNEQVIPLNRQEGFRTIPSGAQDIFQIPHLGFDEFGVLFKKGIAMSNKTFKLINNYDGTGVTSNSNETLQDIPVSTIPSNTTTPNTNIYVDSTLWHRNENMELLIHYYSCIYTLTNQCEHPIYFEFNEYSPKMVISDRYIFQGNTFPINSNTVALQSNLQDPISCIKRDIVKSNTNFDVGLNGVPGTSLNELKPYTVDRTILDRGTNIDASYMKEFKYKYHHLSKKIICVNPGNSVKYNLVIPGFQRHADWTHTNTKITLSQSNGSCELLSLPTWIKQTKFLLVRSWVPTHVYQNVPDTVTPTNPPDHNVGFGVGKFTMTANLSIKYRSIPRSPTHKSVRLNPSEFRHTNWDPDLDVSNDAINVISGVESFVNPENDQNETYNPAT